MMNERGRQLRRPLVGGLSQLLDDLALVVGVFLSDLLGLVGARRLFFKARLLVGSDRTAALIPPQL
jgi:hypothetical protein